MCFSIADYHHAKTDEPTEKPAYLARLKHVVEPPAGANELAYLQQLEVPGADDARQFFELHNGVYLFAPTRPEYYPTSWREFLAGVEIFPVRLWKEKTLEVRTDWEKKLEGHGPLPYGRDDFLAIGHPRGSWNYFHWVIRGPNAGRIYWWPWTMPPADGGDFLADSFHLFISMLHVDPPTLLNDVLGGYSYYFDGSGHDDSARFAALAYFPDYRKKTPERPGWLDWTFFAICLFQIATMGLDSLKFKCFWLLLGSFTAVTDTLRVRSCMRIYRIMRVERLWSYVVPRTLMAMAAALMAIRAGWSLAHH
jgi:hypothetical protein